MDKFKIKTIAVVSFSALNKFYKDIMLATVHNQLTHVNGTIIACHLIVELLSLNSQKRFDKPPIHSLITY